MRSFRFFGAMLLASTATAAAFAEYVVVAKETKVYEQPSVKGYTVTNFSNADVILLPGMAFQRKEKTGGWSRIEYAPGMSCFVQDSYLATDSGTLCPAAGSYTTVNSSQPVTITENEGQWSLTDGNLSLMGSMEGNILIFRDDAGSLLYSALRLNGTTYVFSYDNNVTKFV